MFNNPNATENVKNESTIKDCEPEVLEKLLKFIYQNKLDSEFDYWYINLVSTVKLATLV